MKKLSTENWLIIIVIILAILTSVHIVYLDTKTELVAMPHSGTGRL